MHDNGIETLILEFNKAIQYKQNSIQSNMSKGMCSSWDAYKYQTGLYSGLEEAQEVLKDVYKKLYKSDIDED